MNKRKIISDKDLLSIAMSLAGMEIAIRVGQCILNELSKDTYITFDFNKYYIDDLRNHWHEMLEQHIIMAYDEAEDVAQ